MIYLFHGEDEFATSEKVQRQKNNFVSKHSDINLSVFDEENFNIDSFMEAVMSSPFLGEKRLIILEKGSSFLKKGDWEKISNLKSIIPDTTVIIFQEAITIKYHDILYSIVEKKNVFEQTKNISRELGASTKELLKKYNTSIDSNAVSLLITLTGNHPRIIYNEVQKLISYKSHDKNITIKDIEAIISNQTHNNIFELIEQLAQKNIRKARDILSDLLAYSSSDTKEPKILPMIAYQFRTLLILSLAQENKISDQTVSKDFEIKPYPLQKNKVYLKKFNKKDLLKIHKEITATEITMKSSALDEETGLNSLIIKICSLN